MDALERASANLMGANPVGAIGPEAAKVVLESGAEASKTFFEAFKTGVKEMVDNPKFWAIVVGGTGWTVSVISGILGIYNTAKAGNAGAASPPPPPVTTTLYESTILPTPTIFILAPSTTTVMSYIAQSLEGNPSLTTIEVPQTMLSTQLSLSTPTTLVLQPSSTRTPAVAGDMTKAIQATETITVATGTGRTSTSSNQIVSSTTGTTTSSIWSSIQTLASFSSQVVAPSNGANPDASAATPKVTATPSGFTTIYKPANSADKVSSSTSTSSALSMEATATKPTPLIVAPPVGSGLSFNETDLHNHNKNATGSRLKALKPIDLSKFKDGE